MRPQFSLIIFILLSINVFGQTIQSWNTINVKGKLSDKFQIAVEPESRFSDKLEYFHLDFGLIYLLNKKFEKLECGTYTVKLPCLYHILKHENLPYFSGFPHFWIKLFEMKDSPFYLISVKMLKF